MSTKIGSISINRKAVIGSGDFGTNVFEGEFNKRKVAVKRILSYGFLSLHQEMIDALTSSNVKFQHPNVVKYFAFEEDMDFW